MYIKYRLYRKVVYNMAKKNIKQVAENGAMFSTLVSGKEDAPESDVTSTKKANKPAKKDKKPQKRLNLIIDAELVQYLKVAAFRESTPEKRVSLTQYLCGLIRDDMEKHKND